MKKLPIEMRMITRSKEKSLIVRNMTWEEAEQVACDLNCALRSFGKRDYYILAFYAGKILTKRANSFGYEFVQWIRRGNESVYNPSVTRETVLYDEEEVAVTA